MTHILPITQIISALIVIALILIQRTQGDMGTQGDASFSQTRRGAERFLFFLTIIIALIFVASSIGIILIGK